MKLESKVKTMVIDRGYNSIFDFSRKENVSYYLLKRLSSNQANTIDVPFLLELCKKLDCEIADLLTLKKGE